MQEDGLLSRLSPQVRDRRLRFGRAPCSEVNLCVVVQERFDGFFADANIATCDILCLAHTAFPGPRRADAPVTMMTLPVRSGISFTPHVGRGGNDCCAKDMKPPML